MGRPIPRAGEGLVYAKGVTKAPVSTLPIEVLRAHDWRGQSDGNRRDATAEAGEIPEPYRWGRVSQSAQIDHG